MNLRTMLPPGLPSSCGAGSITWPRTQGSALVSAMDPVLLGTKGLHSGLLPLQLSQFRATWVLIPECTERRSSAIRASWFDDPGG